MNSADLARRGFGNWRRFNRRSEAALVAATPTAPGVYCIRTTGDDFARSIGRSDILYIGSAANSQGLQLRLRQYFHPGPTQSTNKRILAKCGESENYELGFIVTHDGEAAKALERELLHGFFIEHRDLPPENRRLPMNRAVAPVLPPISPVPPSASTGDSFTVVCRGCKREVPLNPGTAVRLRLIADAPSWESLAAVFARAGEHLKCSSCGARGALLIAALANGQRIEAFAKSDVSKFRPIRVNFPRQEQRDTLVDPDAGDWNDAEDFDVLPRSESADPEAEAEAAFNDEEDEFSEFAIYDVDRDEWYEPGDEEGDEDPLDYDLDDDDESDD